MSIRRGFFLAHATVLVTGMMLAGCGGGSSSTPTPSTTSTASATPAYTTATCNTSGATSASITGGTIVGVTSITSPTVGGCSGTTVLSNLLNATAGTYSGTISLTAPAGLPPIPTANTCTNSCGNNGPPSGFSTANFVPLFYVTFELSGYVGAFSQNNPSSSYTVNSLTLGTNTSNFFSGSWQANATGSTPPAISATTFNGWSNNDNATTLTDVPLTVTPPNTLSLPAYACTPAGSACTGTTFTSPESLTVVTVVGYFT